MDESIHGYAVQWKRKERPKKVGEISCENMGLVGEISCENMGLVEVFASLQLSNDCEMSVCYAYVQNQDQNHLHFE
jgi:hypothetical protein